MVGRKLKHNSPYFQVRLKRIRSKKKGRKPAKIKVQRKKGRWWKTVAVYTTEDKAVDRLVKIAEQIREEWNRKEF